MASDDAALSVPAQEISPPTSISPQGQAFLAAAARKIAALSANGPDTRSDAERIRQDAATAVQFLGPLAAGFKGGVETIDLPYGAKLYRVTPEGRAGRRSEVAYFDIHGGGFVSGGGEMCQILAKLRAMDYGVEVFSVDYRLAPDHPYPAGLDDSLAAYREVLKRYKPANLVLGGASAGGNLAAALMHRAKDEGLPWPVALLLLTPGLDLTRSGDTHRTNRYLDVNLYGGVEGLSAYAGAADPTHPYVSPLFGAFVADWPPTLLMSGTRDLLLSDTVRMHRALRRAGVAAELHVAEASPHGGFMGANAPEDADILAECRRFIFAAWGIPA